MNNIRAFAFREQGESHKVKNKVCQDSAIKYCNSEKGLYIIAVSDGHGGESYFRSDKGSELLTEITIEKTKKFIEELYDDKNNSPGSLFNSPVKQGIAITTSETPGNILANTTPQIDEEDKRFRIFLSSIEEKWKSEILKHWQENKPSKEEMEKANISTETINNFLMDRNIEEAYGCTLISVTRTNDFWIAFQIGDGKCVVFNEKAEWEEPIPWDERCMGNLTTSMCNYDAVNSFRYYFTNQNFPAAIFIGSDGMDDAYGGDMKQLASLYRNIIKSYGINGVEQTEEMIIKMLPELSKNGLAKDDMSLAGIIDLGKVETLVPIIEDITKKEKKETIKILKEDIKQTKDAIEKQMNEELKHENELSNIGNEIENLDKKISEKTENIKTSSSLFEKILNLISQLRSDIIAENSAIEKIFKSKNELNSKKTIISSDVQDLKRRKSLKERELKRLLTNYESITGEKYEL